LQSVTAVFSFQFFALMPPFEKSRETPSFTRSAFGSLTLAFVLRALSALWYASRMSTTEIIAQLPKLPEADRRAIRQALLELASQDPEVALCNQVALEGAMMLDRMEEEDARRQSR
jgi:hypothetical protein